MHEFLIFLLFGLGTGGFYALLSSGLVVAFRGSGVINFAHGAVAMYVAFQFYYLRSERSFHLPWVNVVPSKWLHFRLPVRIGLGNGSFGFWPAFLLAMFTAVLLGALMHFLVFRPLRTAAPLGKVIGSLGIMLYLQGVAILNFGTSNPQPYVVLPKGRWNNFLGLGRAMPQENVYLAGVAVLVAAGLWALFKYTRFGLATRAAAGNEKGAALLGYSPERLALTNWVISASVAGFSGIVVGDVTGPLAVTKFTPILVAALGAALVGSLSSIPIAAAAGIVLGMVEVLTSTWLRQQGWFPQWLASGVQDAIPLLVIVGVLFLRGKKLPIRGAVEEKRLPLSPRPVRVAWYVVIGPALAVIMSFIFTGTWSYALSTSLISAMVMLSFVVLTGYVGQISLAQLSLAGVAAFLLTRMESNGKISTVNPFPVSGPNLPWPLAALLGVIAAVVVGVIIGLPALRIRGVQLAVVTIAAASAIQTLYLENAKFTGLQAGSNGVVRAPTLFGVNIGAVGKHGLTDRPAFGVFCAVVLAVMAVVVANIRLGGTGRRFLAVRANERAAAAAGINVARTKILASAIASALAGIAGVMFAFQTQQVSSAGWTFFAGLGFLAYAYLGGITSINGAMIGGILAPTGLVAIFVNYHFKGFTDYVSIIGGIGLILTAISYPGGISITLQPLLRYAGNWLVHARQREWTIAARRFGPTIVVGAIVAALIWPIRNHRFKAEWMIPLGIVLSLMIRATALQIFRGVTGREAPPPSLEPAASPPPAATVAAPVDSLAGAEAR